MVDNKYIDKEISINLETFSSYFNNLLKFAPRPNFPDKKIKPKRFRIVTVSFILSILFSLFIVFILEWWKNNKENVLGE